jgi:predicted alpha/beta superfamily hydrolase
LSSTLSGDIRLHKAEDLNFLRSPRDIIVYLPPDYQSATSRRYPVLYLHDGQNLFDAATAFAGNEWGLDELAEELIGSGRIQPLIIVGIYNRGEERLAEYTPVRDRRGRGGGARAYGKMIVEELKPFIDREYRTLPDAIHTGMGGSSLGGLVTLSLGLRYANVFGNLIIMSPSIWWASRAILRNVRRLREKLPCRIWLDIGTCEGQNPETYVANTSELSAILVEKGWRPGIDLYYCEDEGAGHNEQAWGARMRRALTFLYPGPATNRESAEGRERGERKDGKRLVAQKQKLGERRQHGSRP